MPQPFRFAVVISTAPSREAFIALARRAEEFGYSTLLMPDRTVTGLAPLTALAIAAEATTSLRVGSCVFCQDFRHPALLAKEVATLNFLSGGRFELGLGAGVGPFDYQQLGIPFAPGRERVDRFQEALAVIKQFLTEERVQFAGKHYTASMQVLPISPQKPHVPILIGCAGKQMLSLAAREADSISIMFKLSQLDADAPNLALEEQLAWVREAAGKRLPQIELSQLAYALAINEGSADEDYLGKGPPIPRIVMSAERAVDHLLEQRERYGFSYIPVYGRAQMERFAPIVARLTGT